MTFEMCYCVLVKKDFSSNFIVLLFEWLRAKRGHLLFVMNRKRNRKFYDSAKWINKRKQILKRDGYMCQISKRYGKTKQAEVVHHIWPLEDYPEYSLCDWNLISLSEAEHNKLHDRTNGSLSDAGIRLMQKTIPPGL